MERVIVFLGSFGFCGFFPFAPATFASFVFCLAYILLPGGEKLAHPLVFLPTLVISFPIASHMEKIYGHDARCIVIDEIVAMQLILLNSDATPASVVVAFLLFRVFDIMKPFPVGRSQRLPGGFGVVIDDVIAGIYTRLLLYGLGYIIGIAGNFGF